MGSKLIKGIAEKLRSNSLDVRVVICIAALTAIFNLAYVAYLDGYETAYRHLAGQYSLPTVSGADPVEVARTIVAGMCIVSCLGLLSRTFAGFIISAASLGWAAKEFASWYRLTLVNLKPYDESTGMLASGTWWDSTVLTVVLALLAWQVFTVSNLFSRRRV